MLKFESFPMSKRFKWHLKCGIGITWHPDYLSSTDITYNVDNVSFNLFTFHNALIMHS